MGDEQVGSSNDDKGVMDGDGCTLKLVVTFQGFPFFEMVYVDVSE